MKPKVIFLLTLLVVLGVFNIASAQQEEITLSTYYPAPYGEYEEMAAENLFVDKQIIGNMDVNGDGQFSTHDDIALVNVGNLLVEGRVGIGTTSPGAKLHVVGGDAWAPRIQSTGNNVVNTGDPKAADIVIGSDTGTRHNSSIMWWSSGSASRISNTADVFYGSVWNTTDANFALAASVGGSSYFQGNVGIGTTGPTVPLSFGGSSAQIAMATADASDNAILQIGGGGNVGSSRGAYINLGGNEYSTAGMLGFYSGIGGNITFDTDQSGGSVEKMRITNAGNVGIGTTNPQAKLEVAGNLRATGGIEPDWDSGWVFVNRISPNHGLKTWTHNLNVFPRQIQWWYSPSNPGTWVGPVDWSKQDHWSNPIGVWVTTTQIRFTIWHDRYVYRGYNATAWENYDSGYYRVLLWK